ncbi:FIMAH domain-containing protein [Phytohabitans suffuscus]|uniref:FIMAH domain-containing protein n=1 Tax=Phytohabitans suffuscus TaxID=624315 RepID=A0A6F8YJA7_9ACTN|nr:hypothetical protein [Phytohabitans suffuscus]BCB86215.1 hypothetical protein Psuf_035280 [Phytohabitans suffuscus]
MADGGHTGRHRMRTELPEWLPAWLPDRPTARAWLRQWWVSVASGALILLTAVTVVAVIASRDTERPAAAVLVGGAPATTEPAATPTKAPPTTAPPTPSPTPRRTPASAIDRLAAFATTVQQLVDSGDLDARAGRDLRRMVSGIAVSVQNGRTEKAVDRLRDLAKRLDDLREDDKLSRAGFKALDVIDPIIAALR